MDEAPQQFAIGRYRIIVICNSNLVVYFSASERQENNRTRLLTWKQGSGFKSRLISEDPNSDLETVRTIGAEEFAIAQLQRLLEETTNEMPDQILNQISGILRGHPSG